LKTQDVRIPRSRRSDSAASLLRHSWRTASAFRDSLLPTHRHWQWRVLRICGSQVRSFPSWSLCWAMASWYLEANCGIQMWWSSKSRI